MNLKKAKQKQNLLDKMDSFKASIPNLQKWSWEELDALYIITENLRVLQKKDDPILSLLTAFKCNAEEIWSAIKTQLTCAAWSEGTNEVQHFASFMLAGMQPIAEYTERAIELLSEEVETVKNNPDLYEPNDLENLTDAIAFIERFR